jgi:hypothetical protein
VKFLLPLLAPLLMAVSCAPSTPQARIAENPGRFLRLSDHEKDLVKKGRVDRGMSMPGVRLAWGDPSRRYEGSRAGKPTERWVYSSSSPVYTTTFVTGFGWGGSSRYGYRSVDVGLAPRLDYTPEDQASVLFVNRRVESWERKH